MCVLPTKDSPDHGEQKIDYEIYSSLSLYTF